MLRPDSSFCTRVSESKIMVGGLPVTFKEMGMWLAGSNYMRFGSEVDMERFAHDRPTSYLMVLRRLK